MKLGVAYYPEMHTPDEWRADLANMREAGITLVRILEFAWVRFEPREGRHDWSWVDAFLDLCTRTQTEVVLCTPTATPPAWLVDQFPSIMLELRDGTRRPFGARRDVCVNSPIFRAFTERIVRAMAERYGKHPAVIGWQIDNELLGPEEGLPAECHCEHCRHQFRDWLKRRYPDTDALNAAWGTTFWSQEYSDWGEVPTPRAPRAVSGHVIDYSRFFSDSQVGYIRLQYDLLKSLIDERQWVSHNNTAVFDHGLNHFDYARALDLTGWDAYRWAPGQGPRNPDACALAHDLFRSALHQPFWIFETDTDHAMNAAHLGEMYARGAEAILFWHWRMHRSNQEKGLAALCDHAGRPFADRVAITRGFADRPETQAPIPSPAPKAPAALIFSPDCERHYLRRNRREGANPYLTGVLDVYAQFRRLGCLVDVVQPGDELDGYRLAILPTPILLDDQAAAPIRRFVEAGGTLMATAKLAHMSTLGVYRADLGEPLADVLGFALDEDFKAVWDLPDASQPQRIAMGDHVHECRPWGDKVVPTTAQTLATFEGGLYDGRPAVTRNTLGSGTAYFVAALCSEVNLKVAATVMRQVGLSPVDNPHDDLAVIPHLDGGRAWYINHSDEPRELEGVTVPPRDFVLVSKE